jgi:cytochrome c biogenesis protein CcmG, thiol:disulfide interchange protein DsbE
MRMMILVVGWTLFAAACGGATGGSQTATSAASKQSKGGEVRDFALRDVDGHSVALSDYLGKKVIFLSFWATWCEPCKKEMVQLEELFRTHAEGGLQVLSIAMDEPETQGEIRPYVKQRGFSFPVLLDSESQVTNQFNPRRAAPFSLIIDISENIVWTHEGYVPGDEKKIERAILDTIGQVKRDLQ